MAVLRIWSTAHGFINLVLESQLPSGYVKKQLKSF